MRFDPAVNNTNIFIFFYYVKGICFFSSKILLKYGTLILSHIAELEFKYNLQKALK